MNKFLPLTIIILFISFPLQSQNTYYPWESFDLKDTEAIWIQRELDTSLLIEGESNGSSHLHFLSYFPLHIVNDVIHSVHWANVTDYDGWFYEKIDLESGEVIERNTYDFRDQEERHHHVPMAFYLNSENVPVIISLRNIDAYEETDLPYHLKGAINHLSKQKVLQDTILNQYVADSDSMAKLLYFPYGPDRLYYPGNDSLTYATNFSWKAVNNTPSLSYVRESYNNAGYLVEETDSLVVPVPDSAYGGVEVAHYSQLFLEDGTSLLSAGINHRDAPHNSVMHVYHIDKDWNILGEYDITPYFENYNRYNILGVNTEKMTFQNREDNGSRSSGTISTIDYNGNLLEKIEGFSEGAGNYTFLPRHIHYPKGAEGIYVVGTSSSSNSIDVWKTNGRGETELAERIQAQNPKMSIQPISIQFTDNEDLLMRVNVTKDTVVNGSSTGWGGWKYIMLIEKEELEGTTAVNDHAQSEINYRVYPNPTQHSLQFEWLKDQLPLPKNIQLSTVNGQVVYEQSLEPYQTTLDINLPSGLYLLNVSDQTGEISGTKRIVVME